MGCTWASCVSSHEPSLRVRGLGSFRSSCRVEEVPVVKEREIEINNCKEWRMYLPCLYCLKLKDVSRSTLNSLH